MLALLDPIDPWLAVFGRSHPLLLHLPIGMIVGLCVLEFGAMLLRRPVPRGAIAALAACAAITAVLAAASGWVLGSEVPPGGKATYGGDLFERHKALALATAAAAVVSAAVAWLRRRAAFRMLLLITAGLMAAAGHLGAALTHTETFLFEPFDWREPPPAAANPVYSLHVAPLLQRYCVNCHGEDKQKGELQLHTAAAIRLGGENGAVLEPGKPEASPLYSRLLLPDGDDDHMPPKNKPQPGAADKELLRRWIAAGAPFDVAAAGAGPTAADAAAAPRTSAATSALQALRDAQAYAAPIAADDPLLRVDFVAIRSQVDDARVQLLLAPLAADVAELSLAQTLVTDAAMPQLAAMPNLRELDLRGTQVTSQGVQALQGAPALQKLVLAQTRLDDGAVAALAKMPALRAVYLWQSGVSAAAVAQLQREAPALQIDTGAPAGGEPLQTEPPVELGKEKPAPAPGGNAPAAPTTVNAVCPVTGKPVDPRYTLMHDGKLVGFCCENCPQAFQQDPGKFPVTPR